MFKAVYGLPIATYMKEYRVRRAMELLRGIDGIGIVEFDQRDIIRHRLVKHIVKAFEKEQEQTAGKETPATDEAR